MNGKYLVAAAALAGASAAALAQGKAAEQRPEAFEALVRCRGIAEDVARLQCFDAAAAGLQQAAERRELVVVDREQVRKTKRSLFGLDIPNLNPFSGGPDAEEEIQSIESKVASAVRHGGGRWSVTLEDGSSWIQTDDKPLALGPRKGQTVLVKKAAMGSYMMRVNNQPAVRVRRTV